MILSNFYNKAKSFFSSNSEHKITLADVLHNRSTSGFDLSVATGLAFESLFTPNKPLIDPSRKPPTKVNVRDYNCFYFNVDTLVRNMVTALDKDMYAKCDLSILKELFLYEVEVIKDLFKDKCKLIIFNSDYSHLLSKFSLSNKFISFREEKSASSIRYRAVVNYILKNTKDDLDIPKYKELDKDNGSSALILTHYPADLLPYKDFKKLDLLESHTGKLKTYINWYSKYYPISGKDMSILPFTKKLLFIFGDKYQIAPTPIKLRTSIYEVASNSNWSPLTTEKKINLDLKLKLKDQYIYDLYKSI